MPKFHVFLIAFISFLFFMVVLESFLSLSASYLAAFQETYWNSMAHNWYIFMAYSIYPIRDFFVASLFAYLYYCRGVKDQKRDLDKLSRSAHEQMIKTIAIT